MNDRISVAVFWLTYGPYHLVRAKALAQQQELECHFIELTGNDETHPWKCVSSKEGLRLLTLSGRRLPARQACRRVRQELRRIDPDIVVTCNYALTEMRVAARWAKRRNRGSIMLSDSTLLDSPRYRLKELAKCWMMRTHFDAALISGIRTREYLTSLGMPSSRMCEVFDVVNNDYFADAASAVRRQADFHRLRLGVPNTYFLFVGRLSPEKNLTRLLQAYGTYRQRKPEGFGLVFVGDGPEKNELQLFASRLGLTDVLWVGFQQLDELSVYYSLAECLVLPSTSEPWGLVVNEAMACGLPVLVSSHCGCGPELVRPGQNGFVFNPYDVAEIAGLLDSFSLLEKAQRRKMGAVSSAIVSMYSPERFAKNLTDCVRVIATDIRESRCNRGGALFSLASSLRWWQNSVRPR